MEAKISTNVFINNYNASGEQRLVEDLIIESIKFYGNDSFYMPRTIENFDPLYGTDTISQYNTAYPIEMYIKNTSGFQGDGEFLSKFNIQIREQTTFTISIRRFLEEVPNRERPNEGDLIYFPMIGKLFVIKLTNYRPVFYQFGTLQMYDLVCETFEYSGEEINTGIPEIDNIEKNYTVNIQDWKFDTEDSKYFLQTEDGMAILLESVKGQEAAQALEDNEEIETEANTIIDFSEESPYGEELV